MSYCRLCAEPDICPNCGEEAGAGADCPECGEYVPTPDDIADELADAELDRLRDES